MKRVKTALVIGFLMLIQTVFGADSGTIAPESGVMDVSARAKRTEAFYSSINARSERNWLLKTVYPMMFRGDSTKVVVQVDDPAFVSSQGKMIRSIEILRLNVFLNNANGEKNIMRAVYKAGDMIHLNTREWIVRENLFFRVGDHVDAATLKRNLTYLRNLNYINEARILIVPAKDDSDAVDMVVIIRDKFSINLGGQIASLNRFKMKIDDYNFIGWGHQLENVWHIDPDRQGSIGWESYYCIPNLKGTFIRGELQWQDLPGYTKKKALLNRPFLHPAFHHAGGVDINDTFVRAPVDTTEVDKLTLGGWYGYSFPGIEGTQYTYAALSLERVWFQRRPQVEEDEGSLMHEKLLALGSVAVTKSSYRRIPNVYSFLDSDRIPVGFMLELPLGYEFGEYYNREFAGIRGSWGQVFGNGGYIHLEGCGETFIRKDRLEQSVIALEPLFITPIQHIGSYSSRTFCKGRMILGIERFKGETLHLKTDPFFRGDRDLNGSSMLDLSIERDFIAPWDLIGFNLAFFGFVDSAIVSDTPLAPKAEDILVTEGLGVRLRNPRLVWESIQLQVAWTQGEGQFGKPKFTLSTKLPLRLLDFEGRRPRPYDF